MFLLVGIPGVPLPGCGFLLGKEKSLNYFVPGAENAMLTAEECIPFPAFSIKHERRDALSLSNKHHSQTVLA